MPVRRDEGPGEIGFFFDNTELWLAVADLDGRILVANPAWRRGFEQLDVRPERLDDVLPAAMVASVVRGNADANRPERPLVKGPGGRWLEAAVSRRDDRYLVALLEAGEDGASSPDVEAARRSRDLLLQDAHVGAWRYDPIADAYDFSPEIAQGYRADPALVPRVVLDSLVHRDDLPLERAIRERICREGGTGEIEMRMRLPDGSGWNYVRIHMRAGRRLPDGGFEMYGLTQRITELAQARDAARANAERLKMALGAAHAAVFEVDFVQRYVKAHEGFAAIFGREFDFEDMMSGKAFEAMTEADRDALRARSGRWGAAGFESLDVRTFVEGEARWVRLYFDVRRDASGAPLFGVGLVQDIDERKRQEIELETARRVAEAATAAKSDFLASVSHEIRTPMNGIVGVLHLLKAEKISPSARALLDEALACSSMLGQLINDVLDLSKIEAGKLEISPEPTDPHAALDGVLNLVRPQAVAKGLWLRAEVEPGLGWIVADPVRLRQCLFNLIGNAVKFTSEGGVTIRMRRLAGERLLVEVEDTGCGIPADAQVRLFNRFEQAEHRTAREHGGTGLGLAICRTLAQLMGGDVTVESEVGQGSLFRLEITAAPCVEAGVEPGPTEATLSGLRVLLVDDNATNRLVGVKILEALGAQGVSCEGGAEAVEAVQAESYDLVLMDVSMPGMDGIEATRIIRALPGSTAATPVVALTANVMTHQRRAYLAAGMDGVVAKPFSPAELLVEVVRVLSATEHRDRALNG